MARRRGFTLIELLVVVGIIAILLGILLPVITGIRGAARRTVCSSRLRDLALASISYRQDHGRFPAPPRGAALASATEAGAAASLLPHMIEVRLLNDLSPYLRYPTIEDRAPLSALPPNVQCPFVEDVMIDRGPLLATDPQYSSYYTGFMYVAGMEQSAVVAILTADLDEEEPEVELSLSIGPLMPVLLKPERAARAIEPRRAVIWADDLHLTLLPTATWSHAHPFARGLAMTSAFAGQHCAFTDGSVEWRTKDKLELDVDSDSGKGKSRRKLDRAASFKIEGNSYWWF